MKKVRASKSASSQVKPGKTDRVKKVKAPEAQSVLWEGLEMMHRHAAGIDVGSAENFVCVPAHAVESGQAAVRAFGVYTEQQAALVEWLQACQITTVAMEATGIYWMTLYDRLEEAGLEVVLVEPRSVKQVPGRKSDVLDCQWLQKLHTYGLLSGSFRPEAAIRRLRTLTRHRLELVQQGASCLQHIEKATVQMNLHLHRVVSDIQGDTGLRILQAILNGQRDPKELVKLRDPRCKKSTVAEMEAGLQGQYTEELLFVVGQSLANWKHFQKQLEACDQQIAAALAALPTAQPVTVAIPPKAVPPAPEAKKTKKGSGRGYNDLRMDSAQLSAQLQRVCGVDLMNVCGLNLLSVVMLIAEIGVDMNRWRSAKAFCSWLGLCPGAKISGGKVLSRRTRKVVNRASVILRVAALAVGRTDSWLGRFYRRKKAHLGAPKAITATARKLACVIYHMLKYQEDFVPLDVTVYEFRAAEARQRKLRQEAEATAARREYERLAFAAMDGVDLLLTPTLAFVAPPADIDEIATRAGFVLRTFPFNVLGWPALALPCGPAEDGLPASVQVVGLSGTDPFILGVGKALERALKW
jgi:transposase